MGFFVIWSVMIQRDIEALIQPLLEALGYIFWGSEYQTQQGGALLRIYIDKPDGIRLEDCEYVSRQVSALLDVEDPISGRYALEVSSPGIPRPLFKPGQYAAYLGQAVQLRLGRPMNGSRKMTGEIVHVNDETLTLQIGEEQVCIPFSYIMKAQLIGE